MKTKKKKKWVHVRHKIWFELMHPIFSVLLKAKYNYTAKRCKLDKKQNYLILANHTCTLDPFMVSKSFHRPVYYVASDDLLKNNFSSKIMAHAVAPIPIRKGVLDLACIKTCINIAKEGGTIGLFPEGNRSYTGELGHISKSIVKFVRALKIPLILYHIDGGYGGDPRWGKSARKSSGMKGEVKRILNLEEIQSLNDDELYDLIIKILGQKSNSSITFKSSSRAEFLERVFFICPHCKKMETIVSNGNIVSCSNCEMEAEYKEDLTFESKSFFPFSNTIEWNHFQKEEIEKFEVKNDVTLLSDKNVELVEASNGKNKKSIDKGDLIMTSDSFILKGNEEHKFLFCDITEVVNQGKHRLLFYIGTSYYQFVGEERYSSYKYYLMYHRIHGSLKDTL